MRPKDASPVGADEYARDHILLGGGMSVHNCAAFRGISYG